MRKHYHTSCGGLILAAILTAGAACADVWPSWLSPASGSYDRGNQALSGAVERLTVVAGPNAWTNYITTNIWQSYFSQWAKCDAAKRILSNAVANTGWIYPAADWTPESFERVTHTGLLAKVGAPTNWWTSTPRFNLAMESNGWRFIPDIQSNIAWRTAPVSWYPKPFTRTNEMAEIDIYSYPLHKTSPLTSVSVRGNMALYANLISCINASSIGDDPVPSNPTRWGKTQPPDTIFNHAKGIVDFLFLYHPRDPVYLGTNGHSLNHVSWPSDWPTNGPFDQCNSSVAWKPFPIATYPKFQIAAATHYTSIATNFTYGTNYTVDPQGRNSWIMNEDHYEIMATDSNIIDSITTSSVWVANGISHTNFVCAGRRFIGYSKFYEVPFTTDITVISTNYRESGTGEYGTNTWYSVGEYFQTTNYVPIGTNFSYSGWLSSCAKAQISCLPFVGNVPGNPYLNYAALPTNKPYIADIWVYYTNPITPHVNRVPIPGNVLVWDDTRGGTTMDPMKYLTTNIVYDVDTNCINVSPTAGWYRVSSSVTSQAPIVWGPVVGISNNPNYITSSNLWCKEPDNGEIVGKGWDVTTNTAVIKPVLKWFP